MTAVRSEAAMDAVERRKLHVHMADLRKEAQSLRKLVELTRPAQMPSLLTRLDSCSYVTARFSRKSKFDPFHEASNVSFKHFVNLELFYTNLNLAFLHTLNCVDQLCCCDSGISESEKPKKTLPIFGAMKGGSKFKLKTGTIGVGASSKITPFYVFGLSFLSLTLVAHTEVAS